MDRRLEEEIKLFSNKLGRETVKKGYSWWKARGYDVNKLTHKHLHYIALGDCIEGRYTVKQAINRMNKLLSLFHISFDRDYFYKEAKRLGVLETNMVRISPTPTPTTTTTTTTTTLPEPTQEELEKHYCVFSNYMVGFLQEVGNLHN